MAWTNLRWRTSQHESQAFERAVEMLAQVGIGNPRLLIADEPTTALDVTSQAQILQLMQSLQEQFHMAILMITHNLGLIVEVADRVAVMYTGRIVEMASTETIFDEPLHPYTVGLLRSLPRLGTNVKDRLAAIPGSVPDPFSLGSGCDR